MSLVAPKPIILSTAGAVPVRNEKGEVRMEKTKVTRYFSGKRPAYALVHSDGEEDEVVRDSFCKIPNDKSFIKTYDVKIENKTEPVQDRRLQRLMEISELNEDDTEISGNLKSFQRKVEVIDMDIKMKEEPGHSVIDEDLSDDEIQSRRQEILRKGASMKKEENEEEKKLELEDNSTEDEEDSESEEYEEDPEPEEERYLFKPVFIGQSDRIRTQGMEGQSPSNEEKEIAISRKRRESTLHLIELMKTEEANETADKSIVANVLTDDENEEESYHVWRLRELARFKRNKEEREKQLKEKEEIDRQRNLTEEERFRELELNPKTVTNKLNKGKYKFLQKYYHRGAFYLDEENELLKRDITAPTLEDHFDKTVLPKALQVKNFGKIGRSKYTHLVDQDTTKFDSPWAIGKNFELRNIRRGGMKEPEAKRIRVK